MATFDSPADWTSPFGDVRCTQCAAQLRERVQRVQLELADLRGQVAQVSADLATLTTDVERQ